MPKPADPIWEILAHQGRRFAWLARATGYSVSYCYALSMGQVQPSAKFREAAALALDLPESRLFNLPPTGSDGASDASATPVEAQSA